MDEFPWAAMEGSSMERDATVNLYFGENDPAFLGDGLGISRVEAGSTFGGVGEDNRKN